MKKTEFMNNLKNAMEKANNIDIYVKPTTTIDSGKNGKIFEMLVKSLLHNYKGAMVSAGNKVDTTKKINGSMAKIEIKSGCGELISLDLDGGIIKDIRNNDYVIYTKECDVKAIYAYAIEKNVSVSTAYIELYEMDIVNKAYVFTGIEFYNMLKSVELVREKTSTAMAKKPPQEQFYDRITIQSFKNSKKKSAMFDIALETYGIDLFSWLELNEL